MKGKNTGLIIDLYTEVIPTQISMNEIALFIMDDLGNLYIQKNGENPLAVEEMEWVESAIESNFFDPGNEGENMIFSWGYNAFVVKSDGSIAWILEKRVDRIE